MGSRVSLFGVVTIRLQGVDFLSVVHGDHASILHSYGDMAPQILDAQTWTQKEKRKNVKRKMKGKGREKESGKEKGRERGRRKGMEI